MKIFTEYLNEASKMSLVKAYTLLSDEVETILRKIYDDISPKDFKSAISWNQKTKTRLYVIKPSSGNSRKEFPKVFDALKSAFSKQEGFEINLSFCGFKYNGFNIMFHLTSMGDEILWVEMEVKKV